MQIEVVGVRFRRGATTYSFSPNGGHYKKGDKVIVETERGQDLVTVVEEERLIDASELSDSLKNVLRLATEKEVQRADELDKNAAKHLPEVRKMAKESGLEMKIVSVESNFDGSKLTINFTSDGRVDFRAFAKKLAERFKTRIELRQIGPRDAVRYMGGLGLCGKECCCAQGFGESDHISIKMAKNQNLSLNPSSISGLCGKLLCCLAYENEAYLQAMKEMPQINSFVQTPDGRGKVIYNNLLKKRVSVRFESDKIMEVKEYGLDEIKFEKKREA